ncbi:MAG: hypothetical protein CR988_07045 [Treponema sp.]|nr:MAG: hypothetical protein CR988_07045 [Treponema sp.]
MTELFYNLNFYLGVAGEARRRIKSSRLRLRLKMLRKLSQHFYFVPTFEKVGTTFNVPNAFCFKQ